MLVYWSTPINTPAFVYLDNDTFLDSKPILRGTFICFPKHETVSADIESKLLKGGLNV